VTCSQLQGEALRLARRDVQIIFQDPFASLNPRMRVGEILEEGLLTLRPELDGTGRRQRIEQLATRSACRANRWSATRTSSPAASGSASPSPGRWRSSRG
jgi:ABC-type microcin C transport system duplicated ATPase subunit YejF